MYYKPKNSVFWQRIWRLMVAAALLAENLAFNGRGSASGRDFDDYSHGSADENI